MSSNNSPTFTSTSPQQYLFDNNVSWSVNGMIMANTTTTAVPANSPKRTIPTAAPERAKPGRKLASDESISRRIAQTRTAQRNFRHVFKEKGERERERERKRDASLNFRLKHLVISFMLIRYFVLFSESEKRNKWKHYNRALTSSKYNLRRVGTRLKL
ncbi:hypothetical protein HK100_011718 [Physocladia obscura]|uniref:Uncharacterized protein n=1 Tax=Physocladia obscura TaxID=109957 RepID=A0AAD5T9B7_9FUNG|nr:hypothetical protein HK100_011718 [Physocladia obscura]